MRDRTLVATEMAATLSSRAKMPGAKNTDDTDAGHAARVGCVAVIGCPNIWMFCYGRGGGTEIFSGSSHEEPYPHPTQKPTLRGKLYAKPGEQSHELDIFGKKM